MDIKITIDDKLLVRMRSIFRPKRLAIAAAVAMLVSSIAYAAPGDSVPNSFSDGDPIAATAMNANFDELSTQTGALAANRLYVEELATTGFNTSWSAVSNLGMHSVSRVGKNVEVWGTITLTGTPPNSGLTISLPMGLEPAAHVQGHQAVGQVDIRVAGSGTFLGTVEPNTNFLTVKSPTATDNRTTTVTDTVPVPMASGDTIAFHVVYPVNGWTLDGNP